jgi:hypothetical protein
LGRGIFFLGYFLFEVPSNVILERTGARVWIARIMITWGIAAAVMASVTIVTATYGITFFLPPILKTLGLSDFGTGLATALPYTIGTVGMLLWSWSSDRHNERRMHFVVACLLATIGLIAVDWLAGSYWAILAMSFAAVGLYGSKPSFWPLPSAFLTGSAAAGGIALVNQLATSAVSSIWSAGSRTRLGALRPDFISLRRAPSRQPCSRSSGCARRWRKKKYRLVWKLPNDRCLGATQ